MWRKRAVKVCQYLLKPYLCSPPQKTGQLFLKQVDFHLKRFWLFEKIRPENFGRNKKALTFALRSKKRVAVGPGLIREKAKRSLKVGKQ